MTDGSDRDLRDYVQSHVTQLSGPTAEDAWHSLVEAGPAALPHVIEAFTVAVEPAVRVDLARVICEYRSEQALPFFERLVVEEPGELWKTALDGLVTLGGRAARDTLVRARRTASAEKQAWIDEAIDQIRGVEGPG